MSDRRYEAFEANRLAYRRWPHYLPAGSLREEPMPWEAPGTLAEQIDAHPVLCLLAFLADVVILTVLLWELA